MKSKKEDKKTVKTSEAALQKAHLFEKISLALSELKEQLGDIKFAAKVRKAVKLFIVKKKVVANPKKKKAESKSPAIKKVVKKSSKLTIASKKVTKPKSK